MTDRECWNVARDAVIVMFGSPSHGYAESGLSRQEINAMVAERRQMKQETLAWLERIKPAE